MNFNEVEIVDDATDDFDLIKNIIKNQEQEDAFYILDLGNVVQKHITWQSKIPRVQPHFAVKCNPEQTVINTLAALNAGFDCASKQEISQVLAAGVSGSRIIFANTMKPHSHIKYAKKVGVTDFTVDSEEELHKMKDIFPEANIVIRFRCDAATAEIELGTKNGCDAFREAPKLIKKTKELGLALLGFSFHVGSQCGEEKSYSRGIKIALSLIKLAEAEGFNNVKLIDIGGGFPGEINYSIDMFANEINKALENVDQSIKVISEPGRYYVASAFTLATAIFGKKIVNDGDQERYLYYINDGVFGSFMDNVLINKIRLPTPLQKPASDTKYLSTLWGPTLDTADCVIAKHQFPEFHVGDWLVWTDMGAYTLSMAGTFNGIPRPVVFPFIRKKMWDTLRLDPGVENKEITKLREIAERKKNY